jgi:hypothetical protein
LDKLKFYGIRDEQYNLYKSYLQNRFQIMEILNGQNKKKVFADWVNVTNGVSQGSSGTCVIYNIN